MAENAKWVDTLWEGFRFSYDEQKDDIERLESLQNTYDNKVDESMWPTQSRIPLPLAWAAAEAATGPAIEYLFPSHPSIDLIPKDEMDPDLLDQVTWALYLMLMKRMGIKRACMRSVKDCFKVGIGYGIVEPVTHTPPAVFEVVAGPNRARQMGMGRPVRSLRYRYISPGKIIPYPSGVDFNGEDATPFAYFLDLYPEGQFLKMFSNQPKIGEDVVLKGSAKDMVAESRTRGFQSQTTFGDFVDRMGGRNSYARGMNRTHLQAPSMVPILKCYSANRHTWLYCGSERQIVFDKQNTFDTMRKPLIKFDAWVDADRWYPMSQPEADERATWAKNILFNAVNDLITADLKRPLIYDTNASEVPPDFGPNGTAGLSGDATKTAAFLKGPGVDPGAFQMLQSIDDIHSDITGQRNFLEKNYTRGGSMAFQELLQSSNGRDRLRYALLETGGFENIIWQTLIYMQTLGGGMDLRFQRPAYDVVSGKDYVEAFSVTEDDMKHDFDLLLDLEAKSRLGAGDQQNKIALYDRKIASGAIDDWAASEDLFDDEHTMRRQRLPRAVVQQKQAEREAAELEGLRGSGGGAEGAPQIPALAGRELGGASPEGGVV